MNKSFISLISVFRINQVYIRTKIILKSDIEHVIAKGSVYKFESTSTQLVQQRTAVQLTGMDSTKQIKLMLIQH